MALAEDDEFAEQVIAQGADQGSSGPSLAAWSPEVEYLAAVVDRLGEVVAATIAAAGGKPPKFKPLPRPKTAFDRARVRKSRRAHEELVSEMEAARARRRD